jgi:organic hydroperoxide reductase OsmC/OhrA
MSDSSLRDIGLTCYDVEFEVRKRFRRAWTLLRAKDEEMADRTHRYESRLTWTGSTASLPFRNHDRSYQLDAPGKLAILGSSDKLFRGDVRRWNPEDLLVASLSACHHLWYMSLCAAAGIVVLAYEDAADGEMVEHDAGGAGQFVRVTLRPHVTLAVGSDQDKALALHETAHKNCFIARSVNFPVEHAPVVVESPK